jgi:hypothetical protein
LAARMLGGAWERKLESVEAAARNSRKHTTSGVRAWRVLAFLVPLKQHVREQGRGVALARGEQVLLGREEEVVWGQLVGTPPSLPL